MYNFNARIRIMSLTVDSSVLCASTIEWVSESWSQVKYTVPVEYHIAPRLSIRNTHYNLINNSTNSARKETNGQKKTLIAN